MKKVLVDVEEIEVLQSYVKHWVDEPQIISRIVNKMEEWKNENKN